MNTVNNRQLTLPGTIHLLVMPNAHLLDVAAPAQVLGHPLVDVTLDYVGTQVRHRSAQGLMLADLTALPDAIPDNTWLVIAGSLRAQNHLDDPDFLAARHWLRKHGDDYALRIAICSGALLAAAAGLLDGRNCTTHHDVIDTLRRLAPKAQVEEDRLFVEHGDWITSAGIATGLDLCLHLVARLRGDDVATTIARETVLYHRRAGGDSQTSFWLEHRNHIASRIHRVQDLVMQAPGSDWSARSLAAEVGIGERQLRRSFVDATGIALGDYLVRARLELATQLISGTRFGLAEVAERAGFGSERSLRRHWTRQRGGSPSMARQR